VCDKRHRFELQFEAEAKADELARVVPPRMVVYWCEECERWCLTSRRRHPRDLFADLGEVR